MKKAIIFLSCLLVIIACNQQKKVITKEQQEFCISTFKLYLNTDEKHIEESLQFIKLLQKHSDNDENIQNWYQTNITHIDSVMRYCIEMAEQDNNKTLLDILEKERMDIVAHPNNTVDNEWQLHSVLALLYSIHCKDNKEYWTKLVELGEWSRMHIEAIQVNWKEPHPLYEQVLNELIQIYEALGNESKKAEIEKAIRDLPKEYNAMKANKQLI